MSTFFKNAFYAAWALKNKIKFELKVIFYYLPQYLIFKAFIYNKESGN